jgi:hypothetical protein
MWRWHGTVPRARASINGTSKLWRKAWLKERKAELLPVPYYHAVFTLSAAIGAIAHGKSREMAPEAGEFIRALSDVCAPRWLPSQIH